MANLLHDRVSNVIRRERDDLVEEIVCELSKNDRSTFLIELLSRAFERERLTVSTSSWAKSPSSFLRISRRRGASWTV